VVGRRPNLPDGSSDSAPCPGTDVSRDVSRLAGTCRAAKEARQLRGGGVDREKTAVGFNDRNAAPALGTNDVTHGTEPYRVSPSPVFPFG